MRYIGERYEEETLKPPLMQTTVPPRRWEIVQPGEQFMVEGVRYRRKVME